MNLDELGVFLSYYKKPVVLSIDKAPHGWWIHLINTATDIRLMTIVGSAGTHEQAVAIGVAMQLQGFVSKVIDE